MTQVENRPASGPGPGRGGDANGGNGRGGNGGANDRNGGANDRNGRGNGSGNGGARTNGGGRTRGTRARSAHARRVSRQVYIRRRILAVVGLVVVVFLGWFAISFGSALTNQSLGSSPGARAAEWFRGHGFRSVVAWAENEWYSHHPPPVGGKPPPGAIKKVKSTTTTAVPAVAHLPTPAPIQPFASPPISGEGDWTPVGRTVDGTAAVYETTLRPDAIHTSYVVGVAWMDTELLKATLYSGSVIPGGGPYPDTAPISAQDSTTLVSAFNAGFLMSDANGGYYTDGQTIIPLVNGAASFVVYKNGSCTVGAWGSQVTMTPDVVSVRQNLVPLVENGQPVSGLNATDTTVWGDTVDNQVYVWRSGLGVTADGALVYVGGPGLNITDLADILVRAGAVRAMELDINQDWVNYSTYQPTTPTGAATATNGTNLIDGMTGGTSRYFESWWGRDFITMSAVTKPISVAATSPTTTTTTLPKHATSLSSKGRGSDSRASSGASHRSGP